MDIDVCLNFRPTNEKLYSGKYLTYKVNKICPRWMSLSSPLTTESQADQIQAPYI